MQNFEEKKLFQHFANLIKIRSTHLLPMFYLFFGRSCTPYRRSLRGEGGILFYLCLSVRPSFQDIFLSNYWWQKSDIWSQVSYRYPISWEAFLDLSDSYFLFADLVGFTFMVNGQSHIILQQLSCGTRSKVSF